MTNITDDYDSITSSCYTDMTLSNCENNENKIDISIPSLLLTKPCGL